MKEYIAVSKNSKEILNSAHLLQSVEVNALILGDIGVGKKNPLLNIFYLQLLYLKQKKPTTRYY